MSEPIFTEINLTDALAQIRDRDRLQLVRDILDGITEDGIIDQIRELVNDSLFDD